MVVCKLEDVGRPSRTRRRGVPAGVARVQCLNSCLFSYVSTEPARVFDASIRSGVMALVYLTSPELFFTLNFQRKRLRRDERSRRPSISILSSDGVAYPSSYDLDQLHHYCLEWLIPSMALTFPMGLLCCCLSRSLSYISFLLCLRHSCFLVSI